MGRSAKKRILGTSFSPESRLFCGLVLGLYLAFAGYLFFSKSVLFPADYLSWFYPFRDSPTFEGLSPFLVNRGYQDVVFFFVPFLMFLGETVAQGNIPLWNPLVGVGLPTGALHGAGFYFPLHWMTYPFFSPMTALHIELSLQYFCAALFSFLLFRRWSKSTQGAVIGALAWTLGGWLASFFQQPAPSWPLVFLPLIFLGLDDIEEKRGRGSYIVASGVALTVLVGHLQMIIASALVVGGTLLFRKQKRKGWMLLALSAGLLLATPHIWSLSELVFLSGRGPLSPQLIANGLLAPREYIGLFFANFMGDPGDGFYLGRTLASHVVDSREHAIYVGQITLILAILAMLRLKDRTTRCLTGFILAGLILAGSPQIYLALVKICPPLQFVTPLRFLPYLLFGICYLATLGWKSWQEKPLEAWEKWSLLGVSSGFVISAASFFVPATQSSPAFIQWLVALAQKEGITKPPYFEAPFGPIILERMLRHFSLSSSAVWGPLILFIVAALVVRLVVSPRARFFCFVTILSVDLSFYFVTMNVPVSKSLFYPPVQEIEILKEGRELTQNGSSMPRRVIGLGRGVHPNILLPYGIANVEFYESILPGDIRKLFETINGPNQLAEQMAAIASPENLSPGLLDLLGVSVTYNHPSESERQDKSSKLAIGLLRETALRAFISSSWKQEFDYSALIQKDFQPRDAVLLENTPTFASHPGIFESVEPTYYGHNTIEFTLTVPEPCLLVLTDCFYPGWKAVVNKQEVPIHKAYGFARAIELPKGECEVAFRFRPKGIFWSLALVILGLGCLFLPSFYHWKRGDRHPDLEGQMS